MRACICLVGVVVALDQNEVLAVVGDEDESLLQGTHRNLNKPLTIKQDHGDLTEADLNALNEDGTKKKRELARAHYGAAKIAGIWSDDIAQQCTAEQMTEAKGDFSKSTCWYQADVFSCKHLDHIQARCCPYCIDPVDTSDVQIVHRRRTIIDWDATNARVAKGIAEAQAAAVRRRRTDQLECADLQGLDWCQQNKDYCKSHSWTRNNGCRKTCGTCGVEGTTTTTTCVELDSVDLCEPCLNALQCQSGKCCPNMFRCIDDTTLTCPGEHGQELAKSTCGQRDCENWPGCGAQKKFDDEHGPFEDGAFCDVGAFENGKQIIDPKTQCCDTCGLNTEDAEDAEEPEEPEDNPRDDSRDDSRGDSDFEYNYYDDSRGDSRGDSSYEHYNYYD